MDYLGKATKKREVTFANQEADEKENQLEFPPVEEDDGSVAEDTSKPTNLPGWF